MGFENLHNPYTPVQNKIDYFDGSSLQLDNIIKYQSLIDTLLFVAYTGHLYVAYAVSFLFGFLNNPKIKNSLEGHKKKLLR